ncbi:hypothetical protein AYR47_15515 [Pseudomonas azotoformans]|uniref:Uncharacterized protein n=1 Tax=Pseudomonas azotoformans TaxID=47878 RepID=A0A127HYR6_PSEAZ|nr:hypothetical protein AYR47_15515 [Pseudomonas azotoformans]
MYQVEIELQSQQFLHALYRSGIFRKAKACHVPFLQLFLIYFPIMAQVDGKALVATNALKALEVLAQSTTWVISKITVAWKAMISDSM